MRTTDLNTTGLNAKVVVATIGIAAASVFKMTNATVQFGTDNTRIGARMKIALKNGAAMTEVIGTESDRITVGVIEGVKRFNTTKPDVPTPANADS